jgi:2-methoxy-6-polyprenyl-1,4-benzoquinol methylase
MKDSLILTHFLVSLTGDIAFRYLRYLQTQRTADTEGTHVTVCDINDHMLKVGQERAASEGFVSGNLATK